MLLLLKKLYRFLRIIVHVLWGVVQAVYYLDAKNTLGEKQQRIIRGWCNQFLHLLHIEKKIHGDIHPGNHLMIANHISWKDILLLNSIYASRFVAKSDIAKWPVIGWLSARTGTLFVKRGNITDIRRLNEQISNLIITGERVTLFPEGATGEGGEISHLYPGLFQSVIDSQNTDKTGADNNITARQSSADADAAEDYEEPFGVQPIVIIYKVDEQLSTHIPYTNESNLLANLWAVLGYDHITADIYFTPLINSENTTRKQISQQSHQQMQGVLNKKL